MPGAASAATSEEWESVGLDDANKSGEVESRSATRRASSTTPRKGSRPGQQAAERIREIFIFEGKELMRVTAQGEPVWATKENESKYDEEVSIGPDLRDPRTHHGPCAGNHRQYYQGANAHGRWRHCYRCGVRLEYTPTPRAPCSSITMLNPKMVHQALEMLRMSGEWDNATHSHMEALIKTVQSTRGLPGVNKLKPEQIYEMMGMGATPSRRKARVTTEPES